MKVKDEIKIRACNIKNLERQIHGRKDTVIYITYFCSEQIERMDYHDYLELEEKLRIRNIKLVVEER